MKERFLSVLLSYESNSGEDSMRLCIFALLLLANMAFLAPCHGEVPGDLDADKIVSDFELETAKQSYQKGVINSSQLTEIENIHDLYPVEVIDGSGRSVTIYSPLKRVVCFNAQAMEMMRTLKCQEKIVGVSTQAQTEKAAFFQELSELPCVGSTSSPDTEAALSLHPDAIIIYATYDTSNCESLRDAILSSDPDVVVLCLDLYKPESYVTDIETMGKIFEREEEASEFIQFYDEVIGEINSTLEKVSDDVKPRVYLESSNEFQTCAKGSGYHQKLEMAGAWNVFADLPTQYPTVDAEAVLQNDPQVVIKLVGHSHRIATGYGEDDTDEMEALRWNMMSRPGWNDLSAVKNGQVYIISNEIFGGAHFFVSIAYLAKMFYPEQFAYLDPKTIHQEYMTRFQGMDYDLDEHGAFIYPPL